MSSSVEKMWRNLWLNPWENRVKASTFLTKFLSGDVVRWEKFGFTRVLREIYTAISTKILVVFTDYLKEVLHIYT